MGTAVVLLRLLPTRTGRGAAALLASSLFLPAPAAAISVRGRGIEVEFDERLHSRVVAIFDGSRVEIGPLSASETLQAAGGERSDFAFVDQTEEPFSDALGSGRRHRIVGRASGLEKTVEIDFYDDWPQVAVMQTTYSNTGAKPP